MAYDPSSKIWPFHHVSGQLIAIWVLGNQLAFMMDAVSWGHMNAECRIWNADIKHNIKSLHHLAIAIPAVPVILIKWELWVFKWRPHVTTTFNFRQAFYKVNGESGRKWQMLYGLQAIRWVGEYLVVKMGGGDAVVLCNCSGIRGGVLQCHASMGQQMMGYCSAVQV